MVFKNQLICLGFFIFRLKLSIWVCLYFSKCEFSSSILHCKIHFVGYYEQDGSHGECKLSIGFWKPQSRFIFHDVNWMFIPRCLICFHFYFLNKIQDTSDSFIALYVIGEGIQQIKFTYLFSQVVISRIFTRSYQSAVLQRTRKKYAFLISVS